MILFFNVFTLMQRKNGNNKEDHSLKNLNLLFYFFTFIM